MTGWWYGNWESHNYIFPFFFGVLILVSAMKAKVNQRLVASFASLFLLGGFIASGVYAEIFSTLPLVSSMHVNPRWMPIIFLGLLGVTAVFVKKNELPGWLVPVSVLVFLGWPIYSYGPKYFGVAYELKNLRDAPIPHCYEPFFGYKLEMLPKVKSPAKYNDPRCFLGAHIVNLICDDVIRMGRCKNALFQTEVVALKFFHQRVCHEGREVLVVVPLYEEFLEALIFVLLDHRGIESIP
jgi:hypothetical protein